jgi:hypothetical protein
MITEQSTTMPGISFQRGTEISSDLLTAMQQLISKELTERTKDFVEVPGFAYGMNIADVGGHSLTITAGVGFLQDGTRICHPNAASYAIDLPSGQIMGLLCVKANPVFSSYHVHPFTGEKHATQLLIGLTWYTIQIGDAYITASGSFAAGNLGLIVAKLTVQGSTYTFDSSIIKGYRSPFVGLRTGV